MTPAAGKEAVFLVKNGGSSSSFDIHLIDTKIYIENLCYRASDEVHPIFDTLGG